MRKLASELGIEAMSLYYHVKSKDDILDGMIDIVFSESTSLPPERNGRPGCANALSQPEACSRGIPGPSALWARELPPERRH
jgi:AcrR family transcriptional regulator